MDPKTKNSGCDYSITSTNSAINVLKEDRKVRTTSSLFDTMSNVLTGLGTFFCSSGA